MFYQVGERASTLSACCNVNLEGKARECFFSPYCVFQARYPVHQMRHEDFTPELQLEENMELPTCDPDINAMFQISDDITLNPLCS